MNGAWPFPPYNPDSSLVAEVVLSPNHGERVGDRLPDMILLALYRHARAAGRAGMDVLPASKVSAHYYVFEDGRIVQCVPEALRAWHAGESFWANETDINSCSIGIEIANPGHDHNYPDFPGASDRGRDRFVPQHHQAPADPGRARACAFRRRARTQARPGREISLAHFVSFRRRPLGRAASPIVPGPDFTVGDPAT